MNDQTEGNVLPGAIQGALPLKRRQVIGGALAGLAVTVLPGCGKPAVSDSRNVDVLLIGGGIMSSTLGMWLRNLEPNWSVEMIERLDGVAQESSNGWNNAGTGHAALAELNYTPEDSEGNIKIAQAIKINEAFQISRQFWAYHVEQGVLKNPRSFINHTPHMSFVWGEDNANYLRKRYDAMKASPLFSGMEYSEDPAKIAQWVPLMMEGRDPAQKIAATWSPLGTDMEFGEITRQFVSHMQSQPNFRLNLSSEVDEMERNADGTWRVTYRNLKDDTRQTVNAKFVFVGAGGAALHLLQMSGISEIDQYGGFPVGGSFLVNDNPDVAMRHLAKAYGKASVGSPPMSVPHLDTRVIDGKRVLLFGPFATFSTRFLKDGSYLDLLSATNTSNLWPMMKVGVDQYSLIEYLAGQLMLSDDDRFAALQEYFPGAKQSEWRLWQAGQRVQIIKKDPEKGGVLKLGTEVVSAQDGSIAGLLGASPGASTAVPIMLSVLEKVFADKVASPEWQSKIQTIVPGYGAKLGDDPERITREWVYTSEKLELPTPPQVMVASLAQPVSSTGVVKPVPDMAP